MKKLLATAILAMLPTVAPVYAAPGDSAWSSKDASGNVSLNFYVFWSKTCPHCHKALPFVKQMANNNPWIKLHLKEVTNSESNIDQYIRMARAAGTTAGAVPAFFYCGQIYTGYGENSTTGNWLLEELKACKRNPAEFDISF